jgi:DNA (cytosine-5)-methyltransferase 1
VRFVSLFAGIGGFDLALERLGHECVFANDNDKYCAIIYNKNFGSSIDRDKNRGSKEDSQTELATGQRLESEEGKEISTQEGQSFKHGDSNTGKGTVHLDTRLDTRDISTIPASDIPDHDLLTGGFPCQAFSIAGTRRGFDDTRGTLFFEIARIVEAKRPSHLLLENVKGLLSHDSGRTFQTILRTIEELGYDVQWQVLNSKNFGVPQNRERVYIVGHLRGYSRPEVFPIVQTNPASLNYVGGILSERSKKWLDNGQQLSRNFPQGSRVYDARGISSTLASQAGGLGAKTGLYKVENGVRVSDISQTLTASYHKGMEGRNRTGVLVSRVRDPKETDTANTLNSSNWRGLNRNQTQTGILDNTALDGARIRKLTPTECERLQGFPDGWTEGVSDTQRYRQLGNAVTVNVVEAIATLLFGQ